MQYIDTGNRDPDHTLGTWLSNLKAHDIKKIRWQSGYFNIEGIAPIAELIEDIARRDQEISCVLGSNNGETGDKDIKILMGLMGCPRPGARIAIASYNTGLFHPKVYHVTRHDGSQAAYVGSANLTLSGVNGLNIEAGLIIDSADGDQGNILNQIAGAIDIWFDDAKSGFTTIRDYADVERLVKRGILGVTALPVPSKPTSTTDSSPTAGVHLKPLQRFPPVRSISKRSSSIGPASPDNEESLPPTPREGFPQYILFKPSTDKSTTGEEALTGTTLPRDAPGLIVRLNNDSVRHFAGRTGTANFSVPVVTISTIQFGFHKGRYERPRAEFPLHVRYISNTAAEFKAQDKTNIMVYGHLSDESSHSDIRMLIPARPVKDIREYVLANDLKIPEKGDPMILEWPTLADPTFKATFVDANLPLFDKLKNKLHDAQITKTLVGHGACWLPSGLAPSWSRD